MKFPVGHILAIGQKKFLSKAVSGLIMSSSEIHLLDLWETDDLLVNDNISLGELIYENVVSDPGAKIFMYEDTDIFSVDIENEMMKIPDGLNE